MKVGILDQEEPGKDSRLRSCARQRQRNLSGRCRIGPGPYRQMAVSDHPGAAWLVYLYQAMSMGIPKLRE